MSQIEELRQIIVGSDSEKLAELKERIENIESRTRDVLEVLPPAINAGIEKDDSLVKAFKAPVSKSLKQAIREEPEEYAQILYPVMGPSIRRAITQAISAMMITINQTLESATSAQGLKLRLQSMRTGVPYGELALRRSLKFKVEHIYLIDRDSGMRITDIAGDGAHSLDSDAVSAMFSAIQAFVQDSFSQNENDRLTDFKVGEYNVWIAHGPNAMLACVIFGDAPENLKLQLYDMLDNIRTEYSSELNAFDGDSSIFLGLEDMLDPLLQLELKDDSDPVISKPSLSQTLITMLLVACVYYFAYSWFTQNTKINTAERYLNDVPGLVVTDIFWEDDKIVVEGLQDLVAEIPYSILSTNDINENVLEFRTVPFLSLDPSIEMRRLSEKLSISDDVKLEVLEDKLTLHGHADVEWLIDNDTSIRDLVTDRRIDVSQLFASFSSLRSYYDSNGEPVANIGDEILEISNTPWLEIPVNTFQ